VEFNITGSGGVSEKGRKAPRRHPTSQRRKRRQLSLEEKWEVFLEVTSQEISQADAARKWNVDAVFHASPAA
jgi:hypothetical protein